MPQPHSITRRHPILAVSAMATVDKAVLTAAQDFAQGRWKGGVVCQIGPEDPTAARLALAPRHASERAHASRCHREGSRQ